MLNLIVDSFMVELKDGSIKNVGAPNKSATAKLLDVEEVEAREYGDSRVKLVASDDEGNEVHVAVSPEQASAIASDIGTLEADSQIFE